MSYVYAILVSLAVVYPIARAWSSALGPSPDPFDLTPILPIARALRRPR